MATAPGKGLNETFHLILLAWVFVEATVSSSRAQTSLILLPELEPSPNSTDSICEPASVPTVLAWPKQPWAQVKVTL